MKTIRFLNENCTLVRNTYANGGIALSLLCEDGSPMATATICMPEVSLQANEIIVKDYSENEGMMDALVKAGVVVDTGRRVSSGWINAPICRLI